MNYLLLLSIEHEFINKIKNGKMEMVILLKNKNKNDQNDNEKCH